MLNEGSEQLKAQAVSGLSWSIAGTVIAVFVQILYASVMARLLTPADFGLVAIASVFLRFGNYFGQLGVGPALIQKSVLTIEGVRTAFTVSTILGIILCGFFVSIAPTLGSILNSDIVLLMQVLSVTILFSCLATTALSILKRNMRFRALAFIELGSYIFGYVFFGITLALLGFGVWSLVAASLAQGILAVAASHAIVRHSLMPCFNWRKFTAIYRYGIKFSTVQILHVTSQLLTTTALGKVGGVTVLGLIDRARLLVELPFEKAETSITKVMFPAMSRLVADQERFKHAYVLQNALVASLFIPTLAGMMASSDLLVSVFLGQQWIEAAAYVPILALVTVAALFGHFSKVACDALDLLKIRMLIELFYLGSLGAVIFTLSYFGVYSMLVGLFVCETLRSVVYLAVMANRISLEARDGFFSIVPGLVASLILGVFLSITQKVILNFDIPGPLALICQIMIGAIVLFILLRSPLFLWLRREIWTRLMLKKGFIQSPSSNFIKRFVFGFGELPR